MRKMNTPSSPLVTIALLTGLIAGCQSPPATKSSPELPPIISRLVKDGKGQPYGRSDANSSYLRNPLNLSSDPGYGYSQSNAIGIPVRNHPVYLNSLRGSEGQPIEYERLGACCFGDDKSTAKGPIDIYRIRIDGKSKEIFLFLDGYKTTVVDVPMGFQQRK